MRLLGHRRRKGSVEVVGVVAELWRYPVKSLLGERCERLNLLPAGAEGDRQWAVQDTAMGVVISAKRSPELFGLRARYAGGAVSVELPGGEVLQAGAPELDAAISGILGRDVRLIPRGDEAHRIEAADPPEAGGEVYEFTGAPGGFFDSLPLHILTTATLRTFEELHPGGAWDARRFRPNMLVSTPVEARGFVEQEWIGGALGVGKSTILMVEDTCRRCVMTIHAQADLPRDPAILRTVARADANQSGVLASVPREGTVETGDEVILVRNT